MKILRLLLLGTWILTGVSAASERLVTVVLSEESASYRSAANSFASYFAESSPGGARVDVIVAKSKIAGDVNWLHDSALIVTIGLSATQAVLATTATTPVLATLLPRLAFEDLHCGNSTAPGRKCSAIYIDQPIERQLRLIQIALPGRRQLGAVLGPTSQRLANELKDAAARFRFSLSTHAIRDASELYPALEAVLSSSDVLLTVADAEVLSSASARSILISAYRFQVPVVAYSESYVKAGATLAVYSSPLQVGQQAAQVAAHALEEEKPALPPPQYPRYFSIKVNTQVARSLGLDIADEQSLLLRLAETRE
jgi:putative tryptophan/tyrosine transport system substrate-binding protein